MIESKYDSLEYKYQMQVFNLDRRDMDISDLDEIHMLGFNQF